MNFVKRAGLYVIRHKMKSLILLLVMTVISTFVLTGIAIRLSAQNAAKDVRGSVGGKIVLEYDWSRAKTENTQYGSTTGYDGDFITNDTLIAIAEIEGVTGYNSTEKPNQFYAAAKNIKFIPPNVGNFGNSIEEYPMIPMPITLFSEKFSGFASGKLELVEGRHFTSEDKRVILIPKELADYNNLSVGDILELSVPDYKDDYAKPPAFDNTFEVEIVGIFTGTEMPGETFYTETMNPSNQGIVDYTTLYDTWRSVYNVEDIGDSYYSQVDIFVEDPINIQNVYDRLAASPQIKGKTFALNIDAEEYETIANPLESLQSLVFTLIIIISAASVAVLALLLTIWTRGRVKETGILMSIGVGKPKIVGQFVLEAIFIAALSFGLSFPVSSVIADKSADFIMAQVVDMQNLSDSVSDNSPPTGSGVMTQDFFNSMINRLSGTPSEAEAITEIDVSVTPDSLMLVYTIGTLLVVCAMLIASYTIIRLKPREILAKMS